MTFQALASYTSDQVQNLPRGYLEREIMPAKRVSQMV